MTDNLINMKVLNTEIITIKGSVGKMDLIIERTPITIEVTISATKYVITRIDSNLMRDIKDINSTKINKGKKQFNRLENNRNNTDQNFGNFN